MIARLVLLTVFAFMLTACGGGYSTRSQSHIADALYDQHKTWQGTPYRLGGLNKCQQQCKNDPIAP